MMTKFFSAVFFDSQILYNYREIVVKCFWMKGAEVTAGAIQKSYIEQNGHLGADNCQLNDDVGGCIAPILGV